jgi:colanic acid/amylovoran biosynthesis glycosyltransferase
MQRYLGLSETFIHAVLTSLRRCRSIVLAESAANLDLFPFEPVYTTASIPRFSWWWLVNGLDYRLADKDEFFEYRAYVRHILKRERVRLIHAHFGPSGVRMLPLRRSLGIPLVTTFYGYDMSELPGQPAWRKAYERLFAEGDLFLVEGGHMRAGLVALGCPASKIQIQRIGVNLAHLPFRERRLEPGQKVVVLFCGRFTEKKGLVYALAALARVAAQYPDLELRIIGDGEERPAIERFIADHRLEPYVRLLGYQPHRAFREHLAEAHLFIQPSVTAADGDTEGGAPTVLLEAQACGVPVLATYHADIPEVVRDRESGWLAPERDVEALAQNWLELLRCPEEWPRIGRAGRRLVEAQHDIETLARQLEERYEALITSAE